MTILGFLRRKCSQIFNAVRGAIPRLSSRVQQSLDTAGESARRLFSWVWHHATGAVLAARNFAAAHPIAFAVLILAILLAHPIMRMIIVVVLGFGPGGVKAGSLAAWIQSTLYGGFVPAGSIFSFFQSFGAGF
ncbi:hypothetical protein JVU11DRAFT_8047 [Chiua virens]|nr:hypothetical protein JVU11DRAFT_8047 [Chiua virens]